MKARRKFEFTYHFAGALAVLCLMTMELDADWTMVEPVTNDSFDEDSDISGTGDAPSPEAGYVFKIRIYDDPATPTGSNMQTTSGTAENTWDDVCENPSNGWAIPTGSEVVRAEIWAGGSAKKRHQIEITELEE